MLNQWIESAAKLFKTIDDVLLGIDTAQFSEQLTQIVRELMEPSDDGFSSPFSTLSTKDQVNFSLCTLAITNYTQVFCRNERYMNASAELKKKIHQQFDKKNVDSTWVSLMSDAFQAMSSAESLGRLNLSECLTSTTLSYEALFLRLKCETLLPRFMQKLYEQFCPEEEKCLTLIEQRAAAKKEISNYLSLNDFTQFSKVPLSYANISNLVGNHSVLTLLISDKNALTENAISCENMLTLIKKHPLLQALSTNQSLPAQDSIEQALQYLAMFGGLSSQPYSSGRTRSLSSLSESISESSSADRLLFGDELSITLENLEWIADLNDESYQSFVSMHQHMSEIITALRLLVPVKANVYREPFLNIAMGKIFALAFEPMFGQTINSQAIINKLSTAVADMYTIFGSSFTLSNKQTGDYLALLRAAASSQPHVVMTLLKHQYAQVGHVIVKMNDAANIHSYLMLLTSLVEQCPAGVFTLLTQKRTFQFVNFDLGDQLNEDKQLQRYHNLVVIAFNYMLEQDKGNVAGYIKHSLTIMKNLLALPVNAYTLSLLKLCLKKDEVLGQFCLLPVRHGLLNTEVTFMKKLQKKIASIEKELLRTSPEQLPCTDPSLAIKSAEKFSYSAPRAGNLAVVHIKEWGETKKHTVFFG